MAENRALTMCSVSLSQMPRLTMVALLSVCGGQSPGPATWDRVCNHGYSFWLIVAKDPVLEALGMLWSPR